MRCPHCTISFYPALAETPIALPDFVELKHHIYWRASGTACPNCGDAVIYLLAHKMKQSVPHVERYMAYPIVAKQKDISADVPPQVKQDYEEARVVLQFSPKASAALSRRCLQAILAEQGYEQKNPVNQIDAVLNETDPKKSLPIALQDTIDAIRNFGNFSAHPTHDDLLQVIAVEEHEAEWCLEILEAMFDHYYIKPATMAKRKAELNKKLKDAGKPPAR